jgi:hypothetical protein
VSGTVKRIQSAIEFLMTYGWAILILVVVLAALYGLGIFNTGSVTPNLCALPANVGCISATLFPTGSLTINIQQATQYTINVVAIGCNDQGTPVMMNTISPQVTIGIGGNSTFNGIQCYQTLSGSLKPYNALIGQSYKGYIIVNYTDLSTGFLHTAQGALIEKVQ